MKASPHRRTPWPALLAGAAATSAALIGTPVPAGAATPSAADATTPETGQNTNWSKHVEYRRIV